MYRLDTGWHGRDRRFSAGGAAAVIAVHAAVLALLVQLEPVRATLRAAAPMMVDLITPAPVQPDTPPRPMPVKPAPARAIAKPQPVVAAPAQTAAPEALQAPPTPAPIEAPRTPAPVAAAAPAPAAAPTAAPSPAPLIEPRFDAAYLNNPAPAYPALSRRLGEEGKVVLRVFVNERGLPDDVQVRTSSGHSRLDGAALDSVRHWQFVPARRGDTAVGAWVLVPVSFSLRS